MNLKISIPTVLAVTALGVSALATTAAPAKPADTMKSDTMKPDAMTEKSAYQPYTKAAFDAAKGQQRVLFFHATWCPTCKAANADLLGNLAKIPKGAVIFKTDYDSEVALKKQYGISYQHTFVLVDAGGKALRKWAGGGVGEIAANLKSAAIKK
jgi:thioredoxin 1